MQEWVMSRCTSACLLTLYLSFSNPQTVHLHLPCWSLLSTIDSRIEFRSRMEDSTTTYFGKWVIYQLWSKGIEPRPRGIYYSELPGHFSSWTVSDRSYSDVQRSCVLQHAALTWTCCWRSFHKYCTCTTHSPTSQPLTPGRHSTLQIWVSMVVGGTREHGKGTIKRRPCSGVIGWDNSNIYWYRVIFLYEFQSLELAEEEQRSMKLNIQLKKWPF